MSVFRLAANSFVFTQRGLTAVGELEPGFTVLVIGRNGAATGAEVHGVDDRESVIGSILLTRAGDVRVPAGARVATSRGPMIAADIGPASRLLESLKPSQLDGVVKVPPKPLDGLVGARMVIPADVVDRPEIESALDVAGVSYEMRGSVDLVVVDVLASGDSAEWSWDHEADLLTLLTSWVDDDCRTRIGDHVLRARLLSALIAAGRSYDARWVPAYRPVECRAREIDRPEAFASVVRSEPTEVAERVVELDAAAIVADRAYVLPSA